MTKKKKYICVENVELMPYFSSSGGKVLEEDSSLLIVVKAVLTLQGHDFTLPSPPAMKLKRMLEYKHCQTFLRREAMTKFQYLLVDLQQASHIF